MTMAVSTSLKILFFVVCGANPVHGLNDFATAVGYLHLRADGLPTAPG